MKKLLSLSLLSSILLSTSLFLSISSEAKVVMYLPNNIQPQNVNNINATVEVKNIPDNSAVRIPGGVYYAPVNGPTYYNAPNGAVYDIYGRYIPQSNSQAVGYGIGTYFGYK